MKFNINDYVKVKLTAHGKELLIKDHKEFWKNCTLINPPSAIPEEDEDGYSKWQMWDLMHKLGHHLYNGCTVPFETTIDIQGENE